VRDGSVPKLKQVGWRPRVTWNAGAGAAFTHFGSTVKPSEAVHAENAYSHPSGAVCRNESAVRSNVPAIEEKTQLIDEGVDAIK
jgi:hypothetical protein